MKIEQVDCVTFNVLSDTGSGIEYMVYNSQHEGWTCTCMWWSIHCKLNPPHPFCKHIKAVKETFIKK